MQRISKIRLSHKNDIFKLLCSNFLKATFLDRKRRISRLNDKLAIFYAENFENSSFSQKKAFLILLGSKISRASFSDLNGEFQDSMTNWPILKQRFLKIRLSLEKRLFWYPLARKSQKQHFLTLKANFKTQWQRFLKIPLSFQMFNNLKDNIFWPTLRISKLIDN